MNIPLESLSFYVLGILAISSALMVVSSNNLVRSIFLFFVTLFSLAGLYVFALADFVAITQVVIYVGGVLVLMLFAFLLSNKELLNDLQLLKVKAVRLRHMPGILVALLFLLILVRVIIDADISGLSWINAASENNILKPTDNTVHQLGINLMTKYLLPFEIVSVLLLMALIGAAHIARKEHRL
ncbi:NADH-quinone oxidoreductase subunit J [Rubrolithibacter danxiaensis]|uniref:NADH-quinone oxidoreductase subunit J family protein n=1 Tax=Rubrolithibacter danxiaensis TaxID=3390805 RepID=UPI003BF7C53B